MYEFILLKTAHIHSADSVIYKGGSAHSATLIGCHCFLIKDEDQYYLIDTGIENTDVANRTKSSADDWKRGSGECSVKEHLDRLHISTDCIKKVFLTHAHYDHISGICHFKNATFYMTRAEYSELYSEGNRLKEYLAGVKEFLKTREIILVDDQMCVGDILLKKRGGHTKGSMSIEVDGKLFVGDTIFVKENLNKRIPAGFTQEREVSDRLLEDYLKYAGQIITSHDYTEEL